MPTPETIICPKCRRPVAEVQHHEAGGFGLETTKEVTLRCHCNESVAFYVPDQLNGQESYRDVTRAVV